MEIHYSNSGATGSQGPVGPKGDEGVQGIQGLQGLQGLQGIQGLQGTAGSSGISSTASASYFSTQNQGPYAVNSINTITLNNIDWQTGVTLVDNSKITFTAAGRYDIQFSAQIEQTLSAGLVNIWLSKNNEDVPNSNTRVNIAASNPYSVASWNFFVEAGAGDYYQLKWSSDSTHTMLESAVYDGHPRIPSVIVTVNQVG